MIWRNVIVVYYSFGELFCCNFSLAKVVKRCFWITLKNAKSTLIFIFESQFYGL